MRRLPWDASLFVTGFYDFADRKSAGIFAGLSIPLGDRSYVSTGISTSHFSGTTVTVDVEATDQSWAPQGSWAHKTIIKPVDKGEFDADLLVYVHPVQGWTAATYIEGRSLSLKCR